MQPLRRIATLAGELVLIVYPLALVPLAYLVLYYLQPFFVVPQRIWSCTARAIELTLFGLAPGLTVQDYFAQHHTAFWDVYFAIPYGAFLYILIGYSIYLSFVDERRLRQFIWAIAVAYLIAITIWIIQPVAPPWYVRAYGCVIDTGAKASAAGLVRFDHLLGTRYFEAFYAQSPAIFGAFPSLHCAFPVLSLLIAWPHARWTTRPLHLLYAASMFVGSLYLDHHWTIDGIAGWSLAFVSVMCARKIVPAGTPAIGIYARLF